MNAPKLNTTNWTAPSSLEQHSDDPEDISPRYRGESDNNAEVTSPKTNETLTSAREEKGNSDATTLVSPAKPDIVRMDLRVEWLNEIRKVIREEVSEGIQKIHYAAENQSRCSISSASGSAISSIAAGSDNLVPFPVSAPGEAVAAIPMAQRPGVHFSDRRNLSKRPAGMLRSPSSTQPPAEWGLLFDGDGYATHRLGQVLRGLAKYLIEDYTPRSSLVITPEKLSTFYAKYRLESERIPFLDVLTSKAKDANDRFADFFDDLECQHYLVQRDSRTRPRVPALTPIGFAQLFTTCILAYPDEEFRRLEKIVAEIPLVADAVTQDGHPEWLPRSIIRSCLPARHDIKNRKLLDGAIDDLMDDLKLPSSGSRRPFPTQASFQRRVSAARTSTRPGQGHRRYSAPRLHSTEGSAPEEYDPRGGRKRFAPGTLHTIGDESAEGYEDSRHRERYRALDRGGSLLSPTEGDAKLRSNDERATQVDSHTPPGRFPRPSLLTNFGSRSQSYTQVYSQPNYPSITIPPPPIGNKASMSSTASLSSGRPRSPQREAHSTSVPNVSTSDSSSSTVIMTPSIVSSISESPSLEQGTLLDMLQHDSSTHQPTIDRDRIPSMSHDNVRKYSVGKKQRETNWTGGDSPVLEGNSSGGGSTGSVPLSTGADRVSTSTSRLERQPHRRLPSADSVLADDNKRLTWGEFLKSQKAGQRGSGGSGGSGGSSSAYQGGY